jgi:hypothetical protein
MFSYFSPVNNVLNGVEFQFDHIIDV